MQSWRLWLRFPKMANHAYFGNDNVRQFRQTVGNDPVSALQSFDSGSTFNGMMERLAKLEGGYDGLKHGHIVTITAAGLVSALLLGSVLYLASKVDRLGDQVAEVPAKVSAELQRMNQTLLQAVSASKEQPPRVILYPAPAVVNGPTDTLPAKYPSQPAPPEK